MRYEPKQAPSRLLVEHLVDAHDRALGIWEALNAYVPPPPSKPAESKRPK
jgi:hypothetical protein